MPSSQNDKGWILTKKSEILAKYGDAQNFAMVFNPSLQFNLALNIERSLTADVPTVRQLMATYPLGQLKIWLIAQMENVNEYTGVKDKMDITQMDMLAEVFMTKCSYLKASEILIFFYKFKSGDFGKLFGSVDPLTIANALNPFLEWRSNQLDKFAQIEKDRKKKEDAERREKTAMTREEYLALKNKEK